MHMLSLYLSVNVTSLTHDPLNILMIVDVGLNAYSESAAETLYETSRLNKAFKTRREAMDAIETVNVDHLLNQSKSISVLSKEYDMKSIFKNYISNYNYHTFYVGVDFNDPNELEKNENYLKEEFEQINSKFNHGNHEFNTDFIKLKPGNKLNVYTASHYEQTFLHPFQQEKTKPGIFYNDGMYKVKVSMMHQIVVLNYTTNTLFKLIIMPYKNKDFMVLILPHKKKDYRMLLDNMTYEQFSEAIKQVKPTNVQLSMPKFTTTSIRDMDVLPKTSAYHYLFNTNDLLKNAFDNVYISSLKHVAVVTFAETGTKIDVGSHTGRGKKSDLPSAAFNVNYPFLYFIQSGSEPCMSLYSGYVNYI
ncbi:hypothetical protein B4U80_13329 [Leptotrombidium deliense]|uniref:Serpin domain-containing protein n=1 Tax=Leptotrombidium deliense TaxID=299467 RepID=A0A443S849_9ACAR|nr:hypothetical protein B4U80_13329 [Leptotrombidium deliense]